MAARRCSPPDNVPSSRCASASSADVARAPATRVVSSAARCISQKPEMREAAEQHGLREQSLRRRIRILRQEAEPRGDLAARERVDVAAVELHRRRRRARAIPRACATAATCPRHCHRAMRRTLRRGSRSRTRRRARVPAPPRASCAGFEQRRGHRLRPADFEGGRSADRDFVEGFRHLERVRVDREASGHDFGERLRIQRIEIGLGVADRKQRRQVVGVVFVGRAERVQDLVRDHDVVGRRHLADPRTHARRRRDPFCMPTECGTDAIERGVVVDARRCGSAVAAGPKRAPRGARTGAASGSTTCPESGCRRAHARVAAPRPADTARH